LIRAAAPDFQMGANGIAFQPPRTLFVANTNQARIARIAIDQSRARGRCVGPGAADRRWIDSRSEGFLCAVVAAAGIFGIAPWFASTLPTHG
jgi:sugar lactone lactonase YvrE